MTTSTHTRKTHVSKAAALRQLALREAEAAQTRTLSPGLTDIIDGFDIRRYGATSPVRDFLRDAITRSTLTGTESVRKHCRHLTALAVFSQAQGLPLTIDALLTTEAIDDYIRRGMPGTEAERVERRRRLLALATNVNPGPTTPAKLAPIAHVAVKPPYSPTERAAIVRVCRTQPTEHKRRALSAAVALSLGAGADAQDLRKLRVGDIEDLGADGLLVHLPGARARTVPVRAAVEHLLREALAGRTVDELVFGHDPDRRNTIARVFDNAALYKVPHLEASRLRATWLADLMTDTVPIALVLKAAGLKSARTLTEVLPHLDDWVAYKRLPANSDAVLRGDAR